VRRGVAAICRKFAHSVVVTGSSDGLSPQVPTNKVSSGAGRQRAGPASLREGLSMANPGIYSDAALKNQVADFNYSPNDSLAQLIVDAWVDPHFKSMLLDKNNAKALFATRGFFWNGTKKTPVVITEKKYNDGYHRKADEVIFVLPDHSGTCPPGQTLLDSARLLMAVTPNGI
jgi:hypothetical protein